MWKSQSRDDAESEGFPAARRAKPLPRLKLDAVRHFATYPGAGGDRDAASSPVSKVRTFFAPEKRWKEPC